MTVTTEPTTQQRQGGPYSCRPWLGRWLFAASHLHIRNLPEGLTNHIIKLTAMSLASCALPGKCSAPYDATCSQVHVRLHMYEMAAVISVEFDQIDSALYVLDAVSLISTVGERQDVVHLDQPAEWLAACWSMEDVHLRAEQVRRRADASYARERRGRTSLYRWYDADERLLYVGISSAFAERQSSHVKRSSWGHFAVRSVVEWFDDRPGAEKAEYAAITGERPLFNHQHNDTPEARRRLVDYLVEKRRTDLLRPEVSRG